jgi:hypothetical protein
VNVINLTLDTENGNVAVLLTLLVCVFELMNKIVRELQKGIAALSTFRRILMISKIRGDLITVRIKLGKFGSDIINFRLSNFTIGLNKLEVIKFLVNDGNNISNLNKLNSLSMGFNVLLSCFKKDNLDLFQGLNIMFDFLFML